MTFNRQKAGAQTNAAQQVTVHNKSQQSQVASAVILHWLQRFIRTARGEVHYL